MSAYTGIEIAIATDKEITLKEYLRDLCLNYNLDLNISLSALNDYLNIH